MNQDLKVPVAKIGRYRLQKRIGTGEMAVVYIAFHERALDRPVALKLLLFESHLKYLRREAETLRKLTHPNIVPLLDFGELKKPIDLGNGLDSSAYLVTPYLPRGSLADRLASVKMYEAKIPLADVTRILRDVTDALDYAHGQGIVHGDIKPGNVLFDAQGRAVLTDFGLARLADRPSLTETDMVDGTPQYASPEQIEAADVGPASDLYSLGVVLYEMATGELPFDVENPLEWASHHLHTLPRPASDLRTDLPEPIKKVLARALAKPPEARFSSGDLLLRAWRTALTEVSETGGYGGLSYPTALQQGFVGREREMQFLREGLERALDCRPAALLVEGEGGIGKTALVEQFLVQVSIHYPELLVARGEGLSIPNGGGTPFHPFSQIFEQITTQLAQTPDEPDIDSAEGKWRPPEGLRRFIRILIDSAPTALEAFLPSVALLLKAVQAIVEDTPLHEQIKMPDALLDEEDLEAPGALPAHILDPWQENPGVFIAQYCQAIVELSRERPMILVLDSLRHADDDSWQLLEQLNRQIAAKQARILLIGCHRSGAAKTEAARTVLDRIKEHTLTVVVGQKDAHTFAACYLSVYYGHYLFGEEFTKRLAEYAGANPRFLQATLSYLDDRGLLTLERQRELTTLPAFRTPASRKAIGEMMDAWDSEQRIPAKLQADLRMDETASREIGYSEEYHTPYDLNVVRSLLLAAFTVDDLRRLFVFTSNKHLKPLQYQFSPADGLEAMVEKIIVYCETRIFLSDLLKEVAEARPRQYARFTPYLGYAPGVPGYPSSE